MNGHVSRRAFVPALLLVVPLACGGTTTTSGSSSDGGGGCTPPSAGAWAISASDYSAACQSDGDCQAVYIGDNACEVAIVAGTQNMPCPNAAIATSSYDAYMKRYEAINTACRKQCGSGSILCSVSSPVCNAGTCQP